MQVTGFILFAVLIALAMWADRRGRAGIAIALFIVSGVSLGATQIGPMVLRVSTAAVNGIGSAALNFFQSF